MVLVGDAKQLGPTVVSRYQVDPSTRKLVNIFAEPMVQPVVERIFNCDYPTYLLNIQHRTVAGVNDFPNQMFYNAKLLNAPDTYLQYRPLARAALKFLQERFGLSKEHKVPMMLLNVGDGITLFNKAKSRSNPHNVV